MTLPSFLERLSAATNAHDVQGIVDCFAEDYVNETPCHPARGFTGREQVRRNWSTILAAVPDHVAEVKAWVEDGPRLWTEWEMRGTRRDGGPHLLRGTMVFTVQDGVATHLRFFLEPVDESGATVDEAVATMTGSAP